MKKYISPEIEYKIFAAEDIITTSPNDWITAEEGEQIFSAQENGLF